MGSASRLAGTSVALLLLAAAFPSMGRTLLEEAQIAGLEPPSLPTVVLPSDALGGDGVVGPSPLLEVPLAEDKWVDAGGPPVNLPGGSGFVTVQPRIINGEVDTQARFPYASLVLWDMGTTYGTCSGSLVAPGFVLTAAHCFEEDGRQAVPAEVRVWIYGTWHEVDAIMVHPGYRNLKNPTSEPSNDVAMVALATLSSVPPARLPHWDQPIPGMKVWAAGFGITETGQSSNRLRYTTLTVLESGECPQGYNKTACPAGFADDFVAGGFAGYTCNGDSGGPIVRATKAGDVVVGYTSFGDVNCYVPFSYYVRIYDHRLQIAQWLQSRTDTSQTGLDRAARRWIADISAPPS
ncbi:hypothetical protein ABPG77_000243 [Micractinium sp. CCAP 211/92]